MARTLWRCLVFARLVLGLEYCRRCEAELIEAEKHKAALDAERHRSAELSAQLDEVLLARCSSLSRFQKREPSERAWGRAARRARHKCVREAVRNSTNQEVAGCVGR
eukprot:3267120-Pleurochrysis_carterae.AAC.1